MGVRRGDTAPIPDAVSCDDCSMRTTTDRLHLPGGDLHTRLTERGFGVTLEGWCEFEIELRPTVRVEQHGRASPNWDLTGRSRRSDGDDPFVAILCEVAARLPPPALVSPPEAQLLQRAGAMLRRASAHGAARCDPVVRRAVLAFSPWDRLAFYTLLANDTTGRLLQAARCVPGALLVLGHALDQGGSFSWIGAELLHDLLSGRRVEPMLDDAIAAIHAISRGSGEATGGKRAAPHVEPGLGHRHLIRRAGPDAAGWFLARAPLFPIVPEEIPSEPADRRAWYSLAALHASRFVAEAPSPQDFRMAGFLSRHAARLGRHARRIGGGLRPLLQDLELVASRIGRAPGPRSDPAKVLSQLARRRSDDEAFEYALAATEVAATGGYPAPPFPADRSDECELKPIVSLDELRTEGRKQRNCALTWIDRVLLGESAFYAGRVGRRRLTLVVSHRPGQPWRLGQAVAFANAPATAEERQVLERWLRKVGAGQEAQRPDTAHREVEASRRRCSRGAEFGSPTMGQVVNEG